MRFSFLSLALSGLLLPAIAQADTFNFTSAGTGFSASGVLTATSKGNGSYTITNITGTGITGLIAANGDLTGDNDNILYAGAQRLLDVQGFAFNELIGGTSYSVNLFSTVAGYEVFAYDAAFDVIDTPVTFTATAVTPEPSTWLLLGSGIVGMVAMQFRKRMAL